MKITKDGYTIIYLCFFISSLFSGWKKIYMHIYQKIIKGKIIIQLQLLVIVKIVRLYQCIKFKNSYS